MLKIVTHSARAHADELLAIALILIKENVAPKDATILRVASCKPEDFPDAKYIVDIGRKHDPAKGWFDHHQFPKDAPAHCAFTLVAEHFGIDRDALKWIERVAILDSKGPFAWFKMEFGRDGTFEEINDALGTNDVLNWFCRRANRVHKDPDAFIKALDLCVLWMQDELDWLAERPANLAYATSNMEIIPLGDFKMIFFRQKETRGQTDAQRNACKIDPSIIVMGMYDDRGNGYSALRIDNNPRVNFLPRKTDPGCIFSHENGFCLKWERNWEGFLDAVKRSVAPDPNPAPAPPATPEELNK